MKKGIIMEKHRRYTIVMHRDGSFQKIAPMHDAMIGQEVYYQTENTKKSLFHFGSKKRMSKFSFRSVALVCIFLLAFTPFYLDFGHNKTYAYVNIDINPSIELKINDRLRVESVAAINDDAVDIVNRLSDYKNRKLEWIIERIMEETEKSGLLQNGKNMLVGVSYQNNPNKNDEVLSSVDTYFSQKRSSWQIATFQIPKDIREKARKKNKSMNVVMANRFSQSNDAEKASQSAINRLDDHEKAIIYSFYNRKKDHSAPDAKAAENNKETANSDLPKDIKKEKNKTKKSNPNSQTVQKSQPIKSKPKSDKAKQNNSSNKDGNKHHTHADNKKNKHKKIKNAHKQRPFKEKKQNQRKWNKAFNNKKQRNKSDVDKDDYERDEHEKHNRDKHKDHDKEEHDKEKDKTNHDDKHDDD